jgi:hypothetical protein
MCLDVNGAKNHQNNHVIWYHCHNGKNQGWKIDRKGVTYPRQPLKDGVKFQLKSKMAGNKAVFWHEHIGGGQYRLRIRNNNPSDNRQWFVFDHRTRSIRAWSDKSKAMSNQSGYGLRKGVAAVVRPFKDMINQKIAFYGGAKQNVRALNNLCLDVWHARNSHHMHTTWWTCHNGMNQAWTIDTKGVKYPEQPLRDGVKFQIKSRMATNRALYWKEHIGGNQFRLRIRNDEPEDLNQWFLFDSRTRTIRSWNKRSHVISNQAGQGFRIGKAAVIRPWKGENFQKITFHSRKLRSVMNNNGKCLDVWGGKNVDTQHTTWWNCHNGMNQAWYIDQTGAYYPANPLADGKKF